METKKAFDLHAEHMEFMNKLRFYDDDVKVLQNRLDEVVTKNNGSELMKNVEHFQNQFIMRKEQIDEMKHAVKEHENYIQAKIGNNPAADHVSLADHPKMREDINTFETAFADMRKEFIGFLSKVM